MAGEEIVDDRIPPLLIEMLDSCEDFARLIGVRKVFVPEANEEIVIAAFIKDLCGCHTMITMPLSKLYDETWMKKRQKDLEMALVVCECEEGAAATVH